MSASKTKPRFGFQSKTKTIVRLGCTCALLGMSMGTVSTVMAQDAEPPSPSQSKIDVQSKFDVSVEKYLMGTLIEATVIHHSIEEAQLALVEAFQEIERIEQKMSVRIAGSELYTINQNAGAGPVEVSAEMFGILQRSVEYCLASDGNFDITIGPLSKLWGFSGSDPVTLPRDELIKEKVASVGCKRLKLSSADTTVAFERPGMLLDLGGIAKGYAVDRAAAVLRDRGIHDFLINAGGDLFASGDKGDGTPWLVGIKHPRDEANLLASLQARDEAVVTSGDYEREVMIDGQRYHHILDPKTGYPAEGTRSVTVVAESAEVADVMATILFISQQDNLEMDHSILISGFLRVRSDGSLIGQVSLENHYLEILDK